VMTHEDQNATHSPSALGRKVKQLVKQ